MTPAGVSGMLPRLASVVITGATGGIGSALVRTFTTRGDDVVAAGRASSSLDSLCAETGAVVARLDLVRPEPLPPSLADLTTIDALRGGRGIRTYDGCNP